MTSKYSRLIDDLNELTPQIISHSIKVLIENNHLYQKIDIFNRIKTTTAIAFKHYLLGSSEEDENKRKSNDRFILDFLSSHQFIVQPIQESSVSYNNLLIAQPFVNIYCKSCNRREAHGPIFLEPQNEDTIRHLSNLSIVPSHKTKSFCISYLCQSCQTEDIVYMISSEKGKLILSGRWPIEHVEVPKFIPKLQNKFYSDALMAFNSGQLLPAIFMLRTFLEQVVRCETQENEKWDNNIDRYYETLDEYLKDSAPSLREVYGRLSEKIHNADADAEVYKDCLEDINTFFHAKQAHDKVNDRKKVK